MAAKEAEIIAVVVEQVGTDRCTCHEMADADAKYYDVRFRADGGAAPDKPGIIQVPKVGSTALMARIAGRLELGYLLAVSETTAVALRGDEFDGLVMVGPLVDILQDLTQRITDLETAMATHTHVYIPTPTSTGFTGPAAGSTPAYTQPAPAPAPQQADIENPNVTHG